jgi:hypothetical protein
LAIKENKQLEIHSANGEVFYLVEDEQLAKKKYGILDIYKNITAINPKKKKNQNQKFA